MGSVNDVVQIANSAVIGLTRSAHCHGEDVELW
jgi:hypothetical protein